MRQSLKRNTRRNTLRNTLDWYNFKTLQHTAIHCNTLQYIATHCDTLQHTATLEKNHSVISSVSNLIWWSSSLGLFCHVPLKRTIIHENIMCRYSLYCTGSVISSVSNLTCLSSSLGLFTGHSPQKSPRLSGSFAERDQKLKASYTSLPPYTAYCTCNAISSVSNLNWWSSSLGLFCHVPLKRDPWDWDWRLRLNDSPNAIGCMRKETYTYMKRDLHIC